jgi:phthiocerol/phenolphthiocerol synthesis type-I polyketide synthase E
MTSTELTGLEIAIVGMAARFPGADTIQQFWQNLCDGVEGITFFSDEELLEAGVDPALVRDPNSIKASGYIENIEMFDAAFFGFSPREARMMDPQQRVFLECAWEALETAGYASDTSNRNVGVFAGIGFNSYMLSNLGVERRLSGAAEQYQQIINNDREFFATRVSYKFNLQGPSITVQCACSTSLVATHLACQSLISGESDVALAGGVSIRIPQKTVYTYQAGGIFSQDGHCRPFDADARGTVVSNGAGVVALKRLSDALDDGDTIYAVIKGSAINNDGSSKPGYTAPSREGQVRVIRAAHDVADVHPDSIGYVETHGTGTLVGDPIEVTALIQAFQNRTKPGQYCGIGSLKSNLGHLDTAAGVAGMMKAALSIKNRMLPPSLNFSRPNPKIDFANSPFYVNTELRPWENPDGAPLRAGVNAFGFGGTNAHIVLEEAPEREPSSEGKTRQLITLSARSRNALNQATTNLVEYLRQNPDVNLADVAYTLQVGRKELGVRRVATVRSHEDAIEVLSSLDPKRVFTDQANINERPLVFMFPGQGSQHINMAAGLYAEEPVFRENFDRCADLLQPLLDIDLRSVIFADEDRVEEMSATLNQTAVIQPALFAIEYSLAQLWMSRGVMPQTMVGHSFGEYVAACLAGIFSLEDGLFVLSVRSRLMQQTAAGGMMTVPLSLAELKEIIDPRLDIAAINSETMTVVAGPPEAIIEFEQSLNDRGIRARRLPISVAAHSRLMDEAIPELTNAFRSITLNPPNLAYVSTVTGTWITPEEATDPEYWGVRHLRQAVRFVDALSTLFEQPDTILLEVGPGNTLTTLARRHSGRGELHTVLNSLPHPQDEITDFECFTTAVGRIWAAGVPIDWRAGYEGEFRHRVPLPTYPFERQRYWYETKNFQNELLEGDANDNIVQTYQDAGDDFAAPQSNIEKTLAGIWQDLLGEKRISLNHNFFELGGDSLLAIELIAQAQKQLNVELASHIVLQYPTLGQLAGFVAQELGVSESGEERGPQLNPLLVPLQTNGSKNPLFLIHPVGGGVYIYRDLVQQLKQDRPIYAIQAQGFDGKDQPINNIPQMAEYYIEIIRSVQPQGPYLLGGSSFGGIVAYEMAQQLIAQGQEIELLVQIDSPDVFASARDLTDDAIAMAAVLSATPQLPVLLDQMKDLSEEEQMAFAKQQAQILEQATGSEANEMRRLYGLLTEHMRAMRDYVPQPYYGSEILYFRATENDILYPPNPERGWVDVAAEGILIYDIQGNHISMNLAPQVAPMAKRLQRFLDRLS